MGKIIAFNCSVIKEQNSYSFALLNSFIDEYRKNNSSDVIEIVNLNKHPLACKTLTSENFMNFFSDKTIDVEIEKLKSAEKLIIASPMTNFNIPATLKNYLDNILVADKTFSYKYAKNGGSVGLLTNLKVQIIVTQGAPTGWYAFGNHANYLKGVFEFVGANVVDPLIFDGTKVEPIKNLKPIEFAMQENSKIINAVKKF